MASFGAGPELATEPVPEPEEESGVLPDYWPEY